MIIGSDSEIMYFFPSFTAKRSCEVHHWSASYIRVSPKGGFFGAKSGCVLYADACTVVCVACVCAVRVTAMLGRGPGEVWLR